MDTKKLLLSTLAGAVTFFLLGWLVWGVLLMDYMEESMGSAAGIMKDPPDIWAIALANVAIAFLVAWIFVRWAGISTFMGGLKAGALIFLLIALYFDFMTYGTTTMMSDMSGIVIDVLLNTVMGAIMGGVIGAVIGMGKKE